MCVIIYIYIYIYIGPAGQPEAAAPLHPPSSPRRAGRILFYSILFYYANDYIIFDSIILYSILFYSILLHPPPSLRGMRPVDKVLSNLPPHSCMRVWTMGYIPPTSSLELAWYAPRG